MKIPSSDFYDGFGLVKGVDPVPWGKVRGSMMYPWYQTWVGLLVAAVAFLVAAPLMLITDERWPAILFVAVLTIFPIDAAATTIIVWRRNRRRKGSAHA